MQEVRNVADTLEMIVDADCGRCPLCGDAVCEIVDIVFTTTVISFIVKRLIDPVGMDSFGRVDFTEKRIDYYQYYKAI